MLTEKQLKERVQYIGASDAAAVLGISRWSTPLRVWAEKTGQIPVDMRDTLAMRLGNKLEGVVGELFTERTGIEIKRVPDTVYHPDHPFIAANLDYVTSDDTAVVEAKTAASWKAREWKEEETPPEYLVQILHQLGVTGKKKGYICCLVGNSSVEIREIERDEKVIQEILQKESEFWNTYVVPKVMPWSITKKDDDTLYKLFPMAAEGKLISLDDEADRICEAIEGFKEDRNHLDGLLAQKENELKALLKDAEVGLSQFNRVSWKNRIEKRFDAKLLKVTEPLVYAKYVKECRKRIFDVKPREE